MLKLKLTNTKNVDKVEKFSQILKEQKNFEKWENKFSNSQKC